MSCTTFPVEGGPSLTSVLATNGGQKHPRHHGHHHHHGHSHHHLPHRQSLRTTLWRPLRLLWREAKTVLWDRGGAPVRRLTALLGANLLSAALVAHWAAASNSLGKEAAVQKELLKKHSCLLSAGCCT